MTDKSRFTIRRAAVGDAQAVATLNMPVQQLHHEARPDLFKPASNNAEMVAHFARLLEQRDDNYILIGELDGNPVGYTFAQVVRRSENPFTYARARLVIDQLSVNPDHRRKGYGRLLTEAAIELAREKQIDQVSLTVWTFNQGAIDFYRRLGFSAYIQSMRIVVEG